MLHRFAVSLIAGATALSISTVAHAAIVCGDYLAGGYQPDEMTSQASIDLATNLRACVCEAECASVCMAYEPTEGDYACGINDPYFAVIGGDVGMCNTCMGDRCGRLLLACYLDF